MVENELSASENDASVQYSQHSQNADSQNVEAKEQKIESGAENEFLTKSEAARLRSEIIEEVMRQTQSLTDKASSRIDNKLKEELNKINDVVALQRKAGISITPEQEMALRQSAYDSVFSEVSSDKEVVKEVVKENVDPSVKAVADLMNKMTNDIYSQAGVSLTADDPEASMVDNSSPMAFLDSLRQAVEKKKQRISTPAEARITSLGKGTSSSLETQYLNEKKNIQGNVNALIELKRKYRAKGLNI